MNRIRVGVVGVGAIGKNHARIYHDLEDAELVAVYDADAGRAAEIAAIYECTAAADLDEFAQLVDAATVATPTVTHLEVGSRLLEAGKHLLVEKPIATDPNEANSLVRLAQESSLILQVGHIERFNPVMRELEKMLQFPRFIESHRLSPFPNRSVDIGVVLDVMIHDIEIILHLVPSPVLSVDAVGVPVLTRREDIANARIRFENGCVANITASRISPEKMRKIRVFQEETYLSLDYLEQSGSLYRRVGQEIVCEEVEIERGEPLALELADFVACASNGREPKVSGQQAAAALEVAVEITRQIHEGDAQGAREAVPAS
ncbi:MAG: Gfo/Idh/MocA family oxidoreductase [Verrucomicrobiales bacterium]